MLSSKSSLANRLLWRIVIAAVLVIPVFISASGRDSFRLPKEILFRLETILLVAICLVLLCTKSIERPRKWEEAGLVVPAAVVLWSFVSMLASTNRPLSFSSFLWI